MGMDGSFQWFHLILLSYRSIALPNVLALHFIVLSGMIRILSTHITGFLKWIDIKFSKFWNQGMWCSTASFTSCLFLQSWPFLGSSTNIPHLWSKTRGALCHRKQATCTSLKWSRQMWETTLVSWLTLWPRAECRDLPRHLYFAVMVMVLLHVFSSYKTTHLWF